MHHEIVEILASDESVEKVEIIGGKVRAYYSKNLFLDIFYNEETRRYDYALILDNKRVLGWDNAPHHNVPSHPHHKHEGGGVHRSDLKGDVRKDLPIVLDYIKAFIKNL